MGLDLLLVIVDDLVNGLVRALCFIDLQQVDRVTADVQPGPLIEGLPGEADYLIVGSGYTGLSAARRLAGTGKDVVVIDADTGERAREAAQALAERLRTQDDAFSDVYVPGAGDFFQEQGLHTIIVLVA